MGTEQEEPLRCYEGIWVCPLGSPSAALLEDLSHSLPSLTQHSCHPHHLGVHAHHPSKGAPAQDPCGQA